MKKRRAMILLIISAAVALSGCARSTLNYEIAECIGTLGKYENNEPVETPKMKAEREAKESESEKEAQCMEALETADALAKSYFYEEAIAYLENSEVLQGDERATEAMESYQKLFEGMYDYEGPIGHFCFTNLVVDTERAFDGDDYSEVYKANMITLDEFQNILNALYESGFILIDEHSLAEEQADSQGNVLMTQRFPHIPNAKKPLMISVENLDYSSIRNGDGVATRLALDEDGKIGAVYTDETGRDLVGPYDVVPVLEAFIEEHPDFSFRGARGIIGISGQNGIFGYDLTENDLNYKENEETVRKVAEVLRNNGWTLASEGYSYQYMADMNYETLREDIMTWQGEVASLIGASDTLMYPFGSEVDYATEKVSFLIDQGFRYLIGMWSDGDHLEVNGTYLRQTRRTVTGYVLKNYPGNFSSYFSTNSIIDPKR